MSPNHVKKPKERNEEHNHSKRQCPKAKIDKNEQPSTLEIINRREYTVQKQSMGHAEASRAPSHWGFDTLVEYNSAAVQRRANRRGSRLHL